LDRRLGGPQSRSGCRGERKIPNHRRESKPRGVPKMFPTVGASLG